MNGCKEITTLTSMVYQAGGHALIECVDDIDCALARDLVKKHEGDYVVQNNIV